MENVDVNQLPEVDSLPDGFVDSSTEPQAPLTPDLEQEKHHCYRKEDAASEPNSVGEIISLGMSNEDYENSEKLRRKPALSAGMDEVGVSAHLEETPDRSCSKDVEDKISNPSSANTVSETSVGALIGSDAKEQVEGSSQRSEKFLGGSSDAQTTDREEISSSESTVLQKGKKQDTSEVKRKSAKRTFKSEKEFLEFTLSYQKVLSERDAAIAVRDKLESLCRELQRQNKTLMEECKRVSSEGQTLRLDLSTKFHDAIKDVSNKLEEQKEESLSQLKENEMLRNKLKQLIDQYTLSEQQWAQKLKQKTLELQLADLKIQQHQEKLIQEQSQMKIYAEQVTQLLATEKNLRQQLTADGEKFQQFQEALLKSNEVFETFKQEIEKMAKSTKELKKENSFLKNKCEKSDVTLIELVEEREKMKKQLEKTKNQKDKLEALCRSLQAERKQNSAGSNSSDAVPV